jgi:uncharacterized repeat protein (TIGR04138 family)
MHHPKLEALIRQDTRYAYEAYEFVFAALAHTLAMMGNAEGELHVSGQQLLGGVRDLAQREFGLMARTVFRLWGIDRTGDFGEIVFNLVEAGLMNKTDRDDRKDFADVYDLDEALARGYRIELPPDSEDR